MHNILSPKIQSRSAWLLPLSMHMMHTHVETRQLYKTLNNTPGQQTHAHRAPALRSYLLVYICDVSVVACQMGLCNHVGTLKCGFWRREMRPEAELTLHYQSLSDYFMAYVLIRCKWKQMTHIMWSVTVSYHHSAMCGSDDGFRIFLLLIYLRWNVLLIPMIDASA